MADRVVEDCGTRASSGEKAVNVVYGVFCTDSSLKEELGEFVYRDIVIWLSRYTMGEFEVGRGLKGS